MVFQQKLLEKAYFIFKLTQSGNGPAGQFWQMQSLHCTKPDRIGRLLTQERCFRLDFEKTADISRRHPSLVNPREMTAEKRAQKFHTDDASLPISG